MTHSINFEVASERATVKEHMLLPPNDGQWKHPEHLNEHEMLQILQRESLNGNQQWLKYKEETHSWKKIKYVTHGCLGWNE